MMTVLINPHSIRSQIGQVALGDLHSTSFLPPLGVHSCCCLFQLCLPLPVPSKDESCIRHCEEEQDGKDPDSRISLDLGNYETVMVRLI